MSVDYRSYEDALKKQYEAQVQARKEAVNAAVKQYEGQLNTLAGQKEQGAREAYIRKQQNIHNLPQRLRAGGINGGLAETSALRINTQYGDEMAQLNRAYNEAANKVNETIAATRAQGEGQMAQDRADYLSKLAELALQEKVAKQQLAAQQAASREAALNRQLQEVINRQNAQLDDLYRSNQALAAQLNAAGTSAIKRLTGTQVRLVNPSSATENGEVIYIGGKWFTPNTVSNLIRAGIVNVYEDRGTVEYRTNYDLSRIDLKRFQA